MSGKSGKGAAKAAPRAHGRLTGHEPNTVQRIAALGRSEARERDAVVSRERIREEPIWATADVAAALLCLAMLPILLPFAACE